MSDPRKEAMHRRMRERRQAVYEKYNPIIVWVRPGWMMTQETSDGMFDPPELIRKIVIDMLEEHDFIEVADRSSSPAVLDITTEFDDE